MIKLARAQEISEISCAKIFGLSRAGIRKINLANTLVWPGPLHDLPSVAAEVAAVEAAYIAARDRRDAAIQCADRDLVPRSEICEITGLKSWRVAAICKSGYMAPRKAKRGPTGRSIEAVRAARVAALGRQREAIRQGAAEPPSHGMSGYNRGCQCDVCQAARRVYDQGVADRKSGPSRS
jgi:hypothetical protein